MADSQDNEGKSASPSSSSGAAAATGRRGKRRRSLASRIALSLRDFFSLDGLEGGLSLDGLDLGMLEERGRQASGSEDGRPGVLLGSWSVDDVRKMLERTGVVACLAGHGFNSLTIRVDDADPYVHRLVITDEKIAKLGPGNDFLFDAFIRRRTLQSPSELRTHHMARVCPRLVPGEGAAAEAAWSAAEEEARSCMDRVLGGKDGGQPLLLSYIEHAYMQNPLHRFSRRRPPLPSQRHPGLGLAPLMLAAFVSAGRNAKRDALVNYPDKWHNAELYLISGWRCANPLQEALVRVLHEDLTPAVAAHGLAAVAWAVHEGRVHDRHTGGMYSWSSKHEQLYPLSARATDYFGSAEYRGIVDRHVRANLGRFYVDAEELAGYRQFLARTTAPNSSDEEDDDEYHARLEAGSARAANPPGAPA